MLEVINAGSTDLSRADNAMILNCWEKSSTPLIKELEQTVSFAERKCGDLMQQLHFYKEYYEKWIHSERLNHASYSKKKVRKCCRTSQDVGSSSENEFEKVNRYFYTKIRNKITEMNEEITRANRKLHDKYEYQRGVESKQQYQSSALENFHSEAQSPKNLENKTTKSEPVVTVFQQKEHTSSDPVTQDGDIKVVKKHSSKSVPLNDDARPQARAPIKRRFSNLQRFKLRSKSLPQGVRRKFGFGGFIEIIDQKANLRNSRSKSKTSVKVDSCRSFKTFKSDGQVKEKMNESKLRFFGKFKRSQPTTARSLQYRASKAKLHNTKSKNPTQKSYYESEMVVMTQAMDQVPQNRNIPSRYIPGIKPINTNSCKEIVPSITAVKPAVVDSNIPDLNHLISKPNTLIPFLRQPIPFIPCSSTSKTFNLGLNVQQVLSMIKHRKHSITLQTVIKNGMRATRSITEKLEPTVNTLFFSQTTTSHSQVTSSLCPARTCIEDAFSIVTNDLGCKSNCALLKQAQAMRSEVFDEKKTDNPTMGDVKMNDLTKLERPEDVWVVEQPDPASRNCKKSKSRCTCFPSKHCVDYDKVLREYTGWKIPVNKANSFTSDSYSTYQPMIAYPKPKLSVIPSEEDIKWSLDENEGKVALMKVHNDLLNLNRKYSSLEEQITQRNLEDYEVNAELDAMESELSVREMEFKDIMNFYQQLIQLKEKLKTLRPKSASSASQTAIQQAQRPKKDPLRPTPSMALTKVLRKIQGLQDKIKLIDAP